MFCLPLSTIFFVVAFILDFRQVSQKTSDKTFGFCKTITRFTSYETLKLWRFLKIQKPSQFAMNKIWPKIEFFLQFHSWNSYLAPRNREKATKIVENCQKTSCSSSPTLKKLFSKHFFRECIWHSFRLKIRGKSEKNIENFSALATPQANSKKTLSK